MRTEALSKEEKNIFQFKHPRGSETGPFFIYELRFFIYELNNVSALVYYQ